VFNNRSFLKKKNSGQYYENHDLNKKYRTPYHLYVIRKGATYDSNLIKVMNNEVREGLHTFASIKEAKLELRE